MWAIDQKTNIIRTVDAILESELVSQIIKHIIVFLEGNNLMHHFVVREEDCIIFLCEIIIQKYV